MTNILYYGDNLDILRKHIKEESIDLIYLDPPFNSKANYNILFKEPSGKPSEAQITAFEDTWHWTPETEKTFSEIVKTAPTEVIEMMKSFRQFVGMNDMMAYLTMMCIRLLELRRVLKETGSIYLHCDPTASHYLKMLLDAVFSPANFRNEIVWFYRRWSASAKRYQGLHDVIFFYTKSAKNIHTFNLQLMPYTEKTNKRWKGQRMHNIVTEKGKLLKTPAPDEEAKGANMGDVWIISIINSQARERLGYPTQKPESLLERIISASSNEGDIILDPFCGCGTAISVAERLKRSWIGIDITHLAINLIKWRLKDMFTLEPKRDYKVLGEPEDISGARDLFALNRYQFQWWATSLINAKPYGGKKKGADTGIDGHLFFSDEEGEYKKAVVQVKGGKVDVSDIRDLGHVMEREKSEIGIFITLEPPTKPMIKEALQKGYYHSEFINKDYQRIQILTIEELLKGKQPDIPSVSSFIKKAPVVNMTPTQGFDF